MMRIAQHHSPPGKDFRACRPQGVDLWLLRTETPWCSSEESIRLLSPSEQDRARQYLIPAVREQFVQARASLRMILAAALGCLPQEVRITRQADGKPLLDPPACCFNVSHTSGLCLIALAESPVGVDVEHIRPVSHRAGLVQRFFAEEERRQFESLPDHFRDESFFRGWTCKEALLKCSGRGLRDLHQCVVDMHPRQPAKLLRYAGHRPDAWLLHNWKPADGYMAALAVELPRS